jgi:hypothetical protein
LGACLLRLPWRMVLPLRLIVAFVLVNVHTQSASHNFPMLKRCVSPSVGKISVRVASGGRSGRLRWAVWVDLIVDPSGNRTVIGESVIFLLLHGTSGPVKCPVDPVSAIAMMGGEGPRVGFALVLLVTMLMHALGVPLSYATTGTGLPPGVLF